MKLWLFLFMAAATVLAQQPAPEKHDAMDPKSCPMHAEHIKAKASDDQRFAQMQVRGAHSMGFDQEKTTHRFSTLEDGGAIEVTVNDPADTADLTAIRDHLAQIAKQFTVGDFSSPMVTHGEMPPGANQMQKLKDNIAYTYEELPAGARVRITTGDRTALKAVHEFLAYQVKEHRTGDAATHSH
jgi:TusA-related sulfurtransferase